MTKQDVLAYMYQRHLVGGWSEHYSAEEIAAALHSTAASVGRHLADAYRSNQAYPFRIDGKHVGNLWSLPTDYDIETKKHTTCKPSHMTTRPPEQLELL